MNLRYLLFSLLLFLQISVSANPFLEQAIQYKFKFNQEYLPISFRTNFADPEILLGFDNIVWGENHQSFDIISNDKYKDALGTETPIILGQNQATIESVGVWLTGITLNSQTGVVTVNQSVQNRPNGMFEYKVCMNGICKNGFFSFQERLDVLAVTKTSNFVANKNGELLEYVVEIQNSSNQSALVQVNEFIQTPLGIPIINRDLVEFSSWSIVQIIPNQPINSNYLSVNASNSLNGSVEIPANSKVKITINLKLKAILTSTIQSKTVVHGTNVSENYLVNNTQISNLLINVLANDLAVKASIQNPNTFIEDNIYIVRVTNVGANAIVSTGNNISVEFEIPFTGKPTFSNGILVESLGNFTNSDNSAIGITKKHFFKLNNNITIQPGSYYEFSFKKEKGFIPLPNNRSIEFQLTYPNSTISTANQLNNQSNIVLYNSPTPGTIAFDSLSGPLYKLVCNGGEASIYNVSLALSDIAAINYKFQMSKDNGHNWEYISDVYNINGNSEIVNITTKTWIRREALLVGFSNLKSYSNIIIVEPTKLDIDFANGINAFSLPLVQGNTVLFTLSSVITKINGDTTSNNIDVKYYHPTFISSSGVSPGSTVQLPEGEHRFTVTAKTTTGASVVGCETSQTIIVNVYDVTKCAEYSKRTFATHQKAWSSGLSGVDEPSQAVPSNPLDISTLNRANAATLTGGVVLLGIGTVGIDLYFTNSSGQLMTLNNKKVVIKLGEQYSGLKIAGGISVRAINTNYSIDQITNNLVYTPTLIGATYGVKGGVLDALKGDNVFEYSVIPSTANGSPVNFNGIRIQLGSLIGVADLASVFYAYIEEQDQISNVTNYCTTINSPITVSPPTTLLYPIMQNEVDGTPVKTGGLINNTNITLNRSAEDAKWGNYSEVLNVASSLSSIVFPYYAVDDDYDSYTLFNATAGVLNRQFLRTKLRQPARPGDQVQITLAYPNINVLNLSLLQLGNFKIVYFNKGAKVQEELLEEFRILDIGLFNFKNKRRAILSRPVNFIYDEVELQQFNTVSVNLGDGLHVHDIRINPLKAFVGMTDPKQVTQLCAAELISIQKTDFCSTYELSFAKVIEFGPAYINADNSPMLDYKGNPIRSIYAIEDIPNSALTLVNSANTVINYRHNRETLFGDDLKGKLLIKIQTKRQDCDYGEPQYLRVDLENCVQGVVNPMIQSRAIY